MGRDDRYGKLERLLAAARAGRGLTQAAVAELLGKPQSFVSKYESGERRLDVVEVLRVCAALGVNPKDIIDRLELGHDG